MALGGVLLHRVQQNNLIKVKRQVGMGVQTIGAW